MRGAGNGRAGNSGGSSPPRECIRQSAQVEAGTEIGGNCGGKRRKMAGKRADFRWAENRFPRNREPGKRNRGIGKLARISHVRKSGNREIGVNSDKDCRNCCMSRIVRLGGTLMWGGTAHQDAVPPASVGVWAMHKCPIVRDWAFCRYGAVHRIRTPYHLPVWGGTGGSLCQVSVWARHKRTQSAARPGRRHTGCRG